MHPGLIQINNNDILDAEKVLLEKGKHFNLERRDFIKNLDTVDLQAVPGSGKTTTLLAKLIILEKYLPLKDGSGILVISHTNAAIDEIKRKIERYCPKLFSYPNFIGTIQSFVDQYLAIPSYCNNYKKKPIRIDNEIYDEKIEKYLESLPDSGALRKYLDNKHDPLTFLKNIRLDSQLNLIPGLNKVAEQLDLKDQTKPAYKSLKKIKINLMSWGYLHFDDAYFLAQRGLLEYPQIKNIIQKRFRFVFVDEMQDMDIHQHDLLEALFYKKRTLRHVYQRVGDKNQAIYSGEVKIDEIWRKREKVLRIKGSHRLTPQNADIVKYFGLDYCDIQGLKTNEDGSAIGIKPYLIIFDDNTIDKVLEKYTEIIEEQKLLGKIPDKPKHKIKAIAWRIKDEEGKLGIKDYHDGFERNENTPKIDHQSFISYLGFYDKTTKSLKTINENIIRGILKVLRLENIVDEDGRCYSKARLLRLIRNNFPDIYEDLKVKLYKWSANIYRGSLNEVHAEIKAFVRELMIDLFQRGVLNEKTEEFIDTESVEEPLRDSFKNNQEKNRYTGDNGIEVELGSVHSIKGETHLSTLYMESYYYCDGTGTSAKSYESQRLSRQFRGKRLRAADGMRVKQSARMVYVGFSRPTHLLCIAVHKDRINHLEDAATFEKKYVCAH